MTVFVYKATDQKGQFVEGDIEATDYHVAVQQIQKLNYFPIQVKEGKRGKSFVRGISLPTADFFGQISQKELMTLTQQLSTLVGAGITLDSSLSSLVKLTEFFFFLIQRMILYLFSLKRKKYRVSKNVALSFTSTTQSD